MRFTAIFVLLAILFLNGCQTDKNPVNVQSSAYFVPSFENGNYWTYTVFDTTIDSNNKTLTDKWSQFVRVEGDTVLHDGTKVKIVYYSFSDIGDFYYVRLAHDSLCFYYDLNGGLRNLILLPLTKGKQWMIGPDTMKVIGWESVETMVGSFENAIHLRRSVLRSDKTGTIDYWLVDKIGFVRIVTDFILLYSNTHSIENKLLSETNVKQ
ncbi:hypothetical protein DRI50_06205 [candidate division KSB1 bacterium]|jgi:hypothetical protein|nr:MAG: hypothetical protein DRI50_06205 [candidate division KSB1 bacterium]